MASIMYCLVLVLLGLTSQLCGMEAKVKTFGAKEHFATLTTADKHEVHIVYMGGKSETTTDHESVHMGMLSQALGSMQGAYDSILYSYKNSFNGFAAVLSESHAETIRGMDGVVSVFKSQTKQQHTTASWTEFLGLSPTDPAGIWTQTEFGNGTIIGMIDSGIWPESHSFNDAGFSPIPSKWNGTCVKGEQFDPSMCNKKLIGAKFYLKGYEAQFGNITAPNYKSPRDSAGHGTHTSSTAGGTRVADASFEGLANGTATGGAPSARIAMYKVCWGAETLCTDADLLAGMEDAIADGVDLMSISIGGGAQDYQSDSIAIGAFHATEKGIIVSCSAGNSGPGVGSAANTAPWIFTVAASTINRVYQTNVELTNSVTVPGAALNTYEMNSSYPIVYAGAIPINNVTISSSCSEGTLDPEKAKGKIIVCEQAESFTDGVILALGAKGFVSITAVDLSVQFNVIAPSTNVDPMTGDVILKFVNSTENPFALIDKTVTVFNTTPAPIMAYFSSVGPNVVTMDMLKPDITAPGVDILGAWAPVSSPSEKANDTRHPEFNIISGTSMSCPHVTGTAALVKSAHPDWTPAAIKSAIMTTATPLNTSIPGNYELASGAGQINPVKASDPGLVFNMTTTDYVNFLCSIGYNSTAVRLVTGGKQTCRKNPGTVLDMNYPSIFMSSNVTAGFVHNITRTVTNVGPSSGPVTYSVTVSPVNNTDIQVIPSSLNFNAINEEQSFSVIAKIQNTIDNYYFGSITWSDGTHSVRMPIGVGIPVLIF